MPDYKKGQIYRLWSPHIDKFYIGSTCSPLAKRLYGHKRDYYCYLNQNRNYMSSFELFKLGVDDVKIELMEDFICQNKKELCRREGEIIRQHKNNIVNHSIAGRTRKEWRVENKDKVLEQQNKYNIDNKDKLLAYRKEYREQNKVKIAEYYQQNKIKIDEQRRQRNSIKKALLSTE